MPKKHIRKRGLILTNQRLNTNNSTAQLFPTKKHHQKQSSHSNHEPKTKSRPHTTTPPANSNLSAAHLKNQASTINQRKSDQSR